MTRIATTHTRLTKIEAALVDWFKQEKWMVDVDSTTGDKIAAWYGSKESIGVNLTELARHLLDEVCA